jgi:(p)ppGpp synthase/HD superfamily hydrolase
MVPTDLGTGNRQMGAGMSESRAPSVRLTQRYIDAVAFANDAHHDHARKGTTVPYLCHVLAVSASVLEAGGDEDQAIAGLLHDVAEDHGGEAALARIERQFGSHVAAIVRGCSDSLGADPDNKPAFWQRKASHLKQLANATDDVIIVTAADKLNNARALVTDLHLHGAGTLDRFTEKSGILWYYIQVLALLTTRNAPTILTEPLDEAVQQLRLLIPLELHAEPHDD